MIIRLLENDFTLKKYLKFDCRNYHYIVNLTPYILNLFDYNSNCLNRLDNNYEMVLCRFKDNYLQVVYNDKYILLEFDKKLWPENYVYEILFNNLTDIIKIFNYNSYLVNLNNIFTVIYIPLPEYINIFEYYCDIDDENYSIDCNVKQSTNYFIKKAKHKLKVNIINELYTNKFVKFLSFYEHSMLSEKVIFRLLSNEYFSNTDLFKIYNTFFFSYEYIDPKEVKEILDYFDMNDEILSYLIVDQPNGNLPLNFLNYMLIYKYDLFSNFNKNLINLRYILDQLHYVWDYLEPDIKYYVNLLIDDNSYYISLLLSNKYKLKMGLDKPLKKYLNFKHKWIKK